MHSLFQNFEPITDPIKIASYGFGSVSDLLCGFCLNGYSLSLDKKSCIPYTPTTIID